MTLALGRPLVSAHLVGRAAQLAALDRCLDRARGGRGHVVLVSGEAGIGKSRLVAEAEARAGALGFRVLHGSCFEPDRTLPFAPLLDMLRTLFATAAEAFAAAAGPGAAELVALLPELGASFPVAPPPTPRPTEPDRPRLFHALAQLFGRLAAAQPLLVTLEDVHWSDDASLEFLRYLARRLARQPILLALTYRNDEVQPALATALAELDRERLATELVLPPLASADVDAMLRAIFALQRPARAEFLEAIYALTEGNPFFIEEVLRALVSEGDIFLTEGGWDRKPLDELRIPRSVQEAVRRRLDRLGAPARELLELAAVAGRRFDFALLEALTGRDEAELLRLLKEAIAAQLVVEETAERFAFRHALTRQAIYGQLLARERRALHRRIGEALERLPEATPQAHLVELAYHAYEAGDRGRTLEYARRAGERAQALYAPRAAVQEFSRALEAAQHLAPQPLVGLYRARGSAYETLGEFEPARGDHEAALGAARTAADPPAEWQALLDLGALWMGRDNARGRGYFEQALRLAQQSGDPAMLGRSLNRLGNWNLNSEQPLDALRLHREALALFQQLDDRRGIAQTFDLLGMTSTLGGDLFQGKADFERAVALFRELDDRRGLTSSLGTLAGAPSGTYASELAIWPPPGPADTPRPGEEALKLARELGWRAAEAYALNGLATHLGPRGEYARALELAHAGLAIAEEIEHHGWMVQAHAILGSLHLDLLALPEARRHLERAQALARQMRSSFWTSYASGWLASTLLLQGERGLAESVLDAVLTPHTVAQTLAQRLCRCARAELALARGDAGLALETVDSLSASMPHATDAPGIPRLLWLRGKALAALARSGEAEQALEAARAAAYARETPSALWRAELALGHFYRTQACEEQARDSFARASELVHVLASRVPDAALRNNFVQQALALLPAPPAREAERSVKSSPGGLTEREREVVALLVRGLTNRQIAAELVISEATATVHVKHILGKLGFASRTQVAAWAARQGL